MPLEPLDVQAALYEKGIGKINEYELRPGVCILPLAEDPPTSDDESIGYSPVIIARLHAPYRVRKLSYVNEKTNNPPAGIPSPADVGKFVFVGGSIGIATSLNAGLSNFDWSVNTEYLFVENCVSRIQDGFVLGSYQVPTIMAQQNAGGALFQPPAGSMGTTAGAIASAGTDAKVGFAMGQSINFYGDWGYNQDSFLPGTLFNDRIANSDLDKTPA